MITSFATWDAVIIQACVEYSFVWSIDYGKRASLFGTVFKQNVLKEEQYQSVLGLLGRDKRMLWRFFPRGFWEKFNLPVVRSVKHKQKKRAWY